MTGSRFGVRLMAIFFALSACIVIAVGVMLVWPGTDLDSVWQIYPARRGELMPHRDWMGPGFLALAFVFAAASAGSFLRRKWGWWLAVAIFSVNGIGDLTQLATGHLLEGAIGVAAAGAILFWLTRPGVRAAFGTPA